MRLSHTHKFVLICIHKTGSTSLREVVNEYSDIRSGPECPSRDSYCHYHVSANDMKKHFSAEGWNWDEYFKFTLVRNPWERKLSVYSFFVTQAKKILTGYTGHSESFRKKSVYVYNTCKTYKEFLKKYCTRPQTKNRQIDWILDDDGKNLMDYIGKLENIQEATDDICAKIGIPRKEAPHKNQSDHKHYTEVYDEQWMIDAVEHRYRLDIEMFDYKFGY